MPKKKDPNAPGVKEVREGLRALRKIPNRNAVVELLVGLEEVEFIHLQQCIDKAIAKRRDREISRIEAELDKNKAALAALSQSPAK